MIQNDEELLFVTEQMECIERALESLRADVYPKNPRNFAIFSEGYVEQIDILKAEIDAYLAQKNAKLPDTTPTQPTAAQHGAKAS